MKTRWAHCKQGQSKSTRPVRREEGRQHGRLPPGPPLLPALPREPAAWLVNRAVTVGALQQIWLFACRKTLILFFFLVCTSVKAGWAGAWPKHQALALAGRCSCLALPGCDSGFSCHQTSTHSLNELGSSICCYKRSRLQAKSVKGVL